jgi:AAA+ superfamily predicted ATPase
MLELLNQLDGFDTRGDVKVIMATNRIETLDPALIRPGRIDRKIEFPLPDVKTKRHIFRYVDLPSCLTLLMCRAQITYGADEFECRCRPGGVCDGER